MSNHVIDVPGIPKESYNYLYRYLYMLEKVNPRTKTCVKLHDASKFKYLFIALGACIEGFAFMRKMIVVDAKWLKNRYGGVLVFAKAQDPNSHSYPLALAVLDRENLASWTRFFKMLKSVIPDSSELVFMSERNQSMIFAIGNEFPLAHHGHCLWHLKESVKWHSCNVNKNIVGHRFMELGRYYTVGDFNSAYESFKIRYPAAYMYVEEHLEKDKWVRVFFPRDRYNLDTIKSVDPLKNVFKEATKWTLIPMLDFNIRKFSDWFNQRNDTVSRSIGTRLVPVVENHLHDLWNVSQQLYVRELDRYELNYEIIYTAGKMFWATLVGKSCSCKMWDYEKVPCLHGLAAYCYFMKRNVDGRCLNIHELCSKYYWTELWALAYSKTLNVVPDMYSWNVPE